MEICCSKIRVINSYDMSSNIDRGRRCHAFYESFLYHQIPAMLPQRLHCQIQSTSAGEKDKIWQDIPISEINHYPQGTKNRCAGGEDTKVHHASWRSTWLDSQSQIWCVGHQISCGISYVKASCQKSWGVSQETISSYSLRESSTKSRQSFSGYRRWLQGGGSHVFPWTTRLSTFHLCWIPHRN